MSCVLCVSVCVVCVSVCLCCVCVEAGALTQAGHSPTCAASPPSLGHPVLLLGWVWG